MNSDQTIRQIPFCKVYLSATSIYLTQHREVWYVILGFNKQSQKLSKPLHLLLHLSDLNWLSARLTSGKPLGTRERERGKRVDKRVNKTVKKRSGCQTQLKNCNPPHRVPKTDSNSARGVKL